MASGCGLFEDAVELEDDAEDTVPAFPSVEDALPFAMWSMTWALEEFIDDIELGPAGLALSTRDRCVLLDADTGAGLQAWSSEPFTMHTALHLEDDALQWANIVTDEPPELNLLALDGSAGERVAIPSGARATFDDAGLLYTYDTARLWAFERDGSERWSASISSGWGLLFAEAVAGGVVLIEQRDDDDDELSFSKELRVRQFDAAGEERPSVELDVSINGFTSLAATETHLYLAQHGNNQLLPSEIHIVDRVSGAVGEEVRFDYDDTFELEPAPEGGVYLLRAPDDAPAVLYHLDAEGAATELSVASVAPWRALEIAVGPQGEVIVAGTRPSLTAEIHRLW